MANLQTKIPTDTWIPATWDEYIQEIENPAREKAKGYYYNGKMRIEMPPIGNDHASDHTRTYALTKLSNSAVTENREIFRRSLVNRGIERRIIPMLS